MLACSKSAACLAVALIVAPGRLGWAQSPPQAVPPQQQQPAADPAPRAEPEKPTEREGRDKRPQRRPSTARTSLRGSRASSEPGPTRRELSLGATILGGYDSNLVGGLGVGGVVPAAMPSGSTAYLDGTLRYFHGNNLRSFELNSNGNLRAYPGYLDGPAAGGVASVDSRTMLGRILKLSASGRLGYEPFFNVLSIGAGSAPLPAEIVQASPAAGILERRTFSLNAAVLLEELWTVRDSTSLSYSFGAQRFTDEGDHADSSSHYLAADYTRLLAPGVRVRAVYGYAEHDYTGSGGIGLPVAEHRIEGGPGLEKALSRSRQIRLSVAAGASYVESPGSSISQPFRAWAPTGRASLALGLSRYWLAEGGYRRDISDLRGVTDTVYRRGTAFVSTGGRFATRASFQLDATYSNWGEPFVGADRGETLNVYSTSAQFGVIVSSNVAATLRYSYYHHAFSTSGALGAGFPARYNRHAVYAGLTVWAGGHRLTPPASFR